MHNVIIFEIFILISQTTCNLIQPEYSIKIKNSENIILSSGDLNEDEYDELEMIKLPLNSKLETKLKTFHTFVKKMEMTEKTMPRFYGSEDAMLPQKHVSNSVQYPDSPYEIAANKKHLSKLERRRKKRKKKKKWKFKINNENLLDKEEVGKREVTTAGNDFELETDYDYLLKHYEDFVQESIKNNEAFKYSEEKPEESVKDIIKKIVDVTMPKNCTNMTSVGLQAVECLVKNYKENKIDQKQLMSSTGIILLIWLVIYLAIAIPLWCSKGWCCCCCPFSCCYPELSVQQIQKYITENPPGIYINSRGEEERYNPNNRETELYEYIKRSLAEF